MTKVEEDKEYVFYLIHNNTETHWASRGKDKPTTVKPTTTLWAICETMHREFLGSSTDVNFEFVALTRHLGDVEPKEKNFDAYAYQSRDPSVPYEAGDRGLVLELECVDGELTRGVEIDFEKTGFFV